MTRIAPAPVRCCLLFCVLFAATATVTHAFQLPMPRYMSNHAFGHISSMSSSSSSTTDTEPLVVIKGQNVELTPALTDYVEKRIGGHLNKLAGAANGAVRECDVILSVSKNPKVKNGHRVEVVTNLKGTTIICQNESPDMYTSIDAAAHALNRKLIKYKERRTAGWHGGTSSSSMSDDLMTALEELEAVEVDAEEEEEFADPEKPKITKVKSFDLEKPISVEEAVFALDYVDHDFYVFKNEETNKLTVVYKRNVGGIGLIEP